MAKKKKTPPKVNKLAKDMQEILGMIMHRIETEGMPKEGGFNIPLMTLEGDKRSYDILVTTVPGGTIKKLEAEQLQKDLVKQTAIDHQLSQGKNKKEKK